MKHRALTALSLGTVATLALVGCSSGSSASGDSKELTVAVFDGWEEGIATSELWKVILEEKGYDVTLESVAAAPVFQGLADGDYDFTTDVWEPITHAEYLDEYGDQIQKLGTWNDQAKLTIAVNEDAPINSLDELAGAIDDFDGKIIGIEPGAGLTSITENAVIPDYGLENFDFVTSSTPAMLSELKAATDAGENIVVTLWEPHWAYSAFPIKNLEDPQGALGDAETLNAYSRDGFSDDFPEVAKWLGNFTMDTELLANLEDTMFNENSGAKDWNPIVKEWVENNRDYVDSLTN